MALYPDDWPRCTNCGDFALDGHLTCGRFECSESEARRAKAQEAALGAGFRELLAERYGKRSVQ